ncbi:hypothetical protein [Nocardioides sp. InS609-2]|uniref:hypothetical protein n=1 Tax=Nocardioides sp. InS609-2 TaxID=2760705 RepID=UPI0020BFF6A7|nr:hypothetical protein [Nocardioides sp. InS609-2]
MTMHLDAAQGEVLDTLSSALDLAGFRTKDRDASGFRARRIPWFGWLSSAAVSPCVLRVSLTGGGVEVVVENTGATPAPRRAAEGLSGAIDGFRSRGVAVDWSQWEPALPPPNS